MVGDELVARLAWVVLELVLLNIQTNVGLQEGLDVGGRQDRWGV